VKQIVYLAALEYHLKKPSIVDGYGNVRSCAHQLVLFHELSMSNR